MNNRSLHTLIQKALDGTLSDQEEKTWQEYLKAHPEAQAALDQEAGLTRMLQQLPQQEPPAHLGTGIMRAIRNRRAEQRSPWLAQAAAAAQEFLTRPGYSFAAGFAAGLGLLVMVLQFTPADLRHQNNQVAGTIGQPGGTSYNETIDLDQLRGQIRWTIQAHTVEVHLQLIPSLPLAVQFSQLNNMTLTSFRGGRMRGIQDLNLTPDNLGFQLTVPCDLKLSFNSDQDEPSPITIEIHQAGKLIYAKIIN